MKKLGRPRRAECTRGHPMVLYRKVHPNGDTYCSKCKLIRTAIAVKRYPERYRVYQRTSFLRRHYGIEPVEYGLLLAAQHYKCAICKSSNWGGRGNPHVDHNHMTGKVRGLLCHRCNTGLGLFCDNSTVLRHAIIYLKQ